MNKAERQAVAACNAIIQIRKSLHERIISLMGYESDEDEDEEEETCACWLKSGISAGNPGRPEIPARKETAGSPARRPSLIRRPPGEEPLGRGLGGMGGIR
jgi:hypothetical protein